MENTNAIKTLTLIERVGGTHWYDKCGSPIQFMGKRRMIQGQLMMDYNVPGDGIMWVMQRTAVVKAEYTEHDREMNRIYNSAPVLQDGEIVAIATAKIYEDGHNEVCKPKQYRFKINGDYSDCAIFEEIN